MKRERQDAILEIIAREDIDTQEALISALAARGFSSTQATVSRDVRELRLVKEALGNGRFRYALPGPDPGPVPARLTELLRSGCLSFDHALHTVVIKTMPGLASAVCGAVDAMYDENILGTVAGDDTGVLIMRSAAAATELCRRLRGSAGDLRPAGREGAAGRSK